MLGVLAKYSAPKKNAKKPVTVNQPKPDFENDNGGWVVFYNPREKKLETDEVYRFDYGEIVRYETEEEAQRSTEENREDWLTYFGIEEEK